MPSCAPRSLKIFGPEKQIGQSCNRLAGEGHHDTLTSCTLHNYTLTSFTLHSYTLTPCALYNFTHWCHAHSTVTHWQWHHAHSTISELHIDIIHTPQLLTPWALYNFTHWHHAHSIVTHWYHAHYVTRWYHTYSTELYTLTPCTLYSCTLTSCALYSYTLTSCTLHRTLHTDMCVYHCDTWHTDIQSPEKKRWVLRAIDTKDSMDVHIHVHKNDWNPLWW